MADNKKTRCEYLVFCKSIEQLFFHKGMNTIQVMYAQHFNSNLLVFCDDVSYAF